MDREGEGAKGGERRVSVRGWLIVCGLAILFLIYGLFIFLLVGDKGPPDWDFGAVEDIPGQSVHSTHPVTPGKMPDPATQHVSERPPLAEIDPGRRKK